MKNENIAEGLSKKYSIPEYAKLGHSCVGMNPAEFDQWYEETFKLENEDKSVQNPYRVKAKQNKKDRDSLPKVFPLKGGKESSVKDDEKSSENQAKQTRF
jgi:hypothetical protein